AALASAFGGRAGIEVLLWAKVSTSTQRTGCCDELAPGVGWATANCKCSALARQIAALSGSPRRWFTTARLRHVAGELDNIAACSSDARASARRPNFASSTPSSLADMKFCGSISTAD